MYLIAFVDLVPVSTEKVSAIRSNIVWNRWKSTLRTRSIKVNLNQGTGMLILPTSLITPGEILESVARSLFTMNEHAIANAVLYLSFLLRIMFVINILSQISFYAKTLQVKLRIFSTKFEGWCKYFSPIKLVSLRKLAPSRNIVCTKRCKC